MTCISPSPPPPPACTLHLKQGYIQVICITPYDCVRRLLSHPAHWGFWFWATHATYLPVHTASHTHVRAHQHA
jgi:hypothetical protein